MRNMLKMAAFSMFNLCFLAPLLIPRDVTAVNVFDMTRVYDNRSLYWPHGQQNYFEHEVVVLSFKNKDWIQEGTFSTGEHGGTHMDAPLHFARGKWALEEIPIERMAALPAVVLDVRAGVENNDDYLASEADAKKWESEYGRIPDGAVVLLCTGWESRWPNMTLVYGNDDGTTNNFHYPGFGGDLSRWLVNERNVYGVGTDGPSVDGAASLATSVAHQTLFKENIWGVEQLLGTCHIPQQGATIWALPMRIRGGSGGPARVYATWGQKEECALGHGAHQGENKSMIIMMIAILFVTHNLSIM